MQFTNKRNNFYKHEITHTHPAANNQYHCQQGERDIYLTDKRSHLQSDEQKNVKHRFCSEKCQKDMNINTKSSHIKSETHI